VGGKGKDSGGEERRGKGRAVTERGETEGDRARKREVGDMRKRKWVRKREREKGGGGGR